MGELISVKKAEKESLKQAFSESSPDQPEREAVSVSEAAAYNMSALSDIEVKSVNQEFEGKAF